MAKRTSPGNPRASWRGLVRFGLVTFPVEALNAILPERGNVTFHQLHAKCHSRIRYEKVCPVHGPVPNDEIIKGYEHTRGKYVEIEAEEIDALRTNQEKALTIDTFAAADEIDPIYLDGRMYVLSPDGAAAREPYAVFRAALEKMKRCGIGKVTFSGKEHVALVRPLDGALVMALLNFVEDVRPVKDLVGELPAVKANDKTLKLAEQLIENWSDEKFDLASYKDEYQQKVRELIDAKVEDREVVTPAAEDEPDVVNLMDALKKSVARGKRSKSGGTARAASATTRGRKKRRAS